MIGERIRDKVAASKARGMWMGGKVPLGYDVRDRKLTVNEPEAARVRWVFELFAETGSGTRPLPPRADGRWTRATSTSCSTTAPTPGRSYASALTRLAMTGGFG